MSEKPETIEGIEPTPRIIVALDASQPSLSALAAAAQLAVLMQAELRGIFVEDIDLLRLCGLPFVLEVGSYSATARPLNTSDMERQYRLLAAQMRRIVAQTAVSAKVNWSFQVTRGTVTAELLAASAEAHLLTIGRVGRSVGKRFGSTARTILHQSHRPVFLQGEQGLILPPVLIYTGSPASERCLQLAGRLVHDSETQLRVLVVGRDGIIPDPAQVVQTLEAQEVQVEPVSVDDSARLIELLRTHRLGTLILPAELAPILEEVTNSAILVP